MKIPRQRLADRDGGHTQRRASALPDLLPHPPTLQETTCHPSADAGCYRRPASPSPPPPLGSSPVRRPRRPPSHPSAPTSASPAYAFDLGQVRLTSRPLAGQPEPDPGLPALRRRRPAAVQLPRQPPAVHQRRRGQRRLGRPELPVPHPHAGALPDRLGPGLRGARRHHLPRQGQLHGRRAGQVPGQQRRRRVQRRLPVRLPRVRLHRPRGRHAQQRQRALLLHPQDPRRPARRLALHRQHPGPRRAAAPSPAGSTGAPAG